MGERVKIVEDGRKNKIVQLEQIIFMGKRKIDWDGVEEFAKSYVGQAIVMETNQNVIHIGKDFPNEFAHSKDTARLRGGAAKAKANAVQGVVEIVKNSHHGIYRENLTEKHATNAGNGWYRYISRFSLPVYEGMAKRYNVFLITVLIRCDVKGNQYLYDMVNIKKETEYPA